MLYCCTHVTTVGIKWLRQSTVFCFSVRERSLRTDELDGCCVRSGCRLLSRGVFAIFGSHTVATINTLRSFSAAFHVPFISTGLPVSASWSHLFGRRHRGSSHGEDVLLADDDDDDDDDQVASYELYMRPSYAHAVVDLLKHYHCRQVWYLYNSNEGKRTTHSCNFTG